MLTPKAPAVKSNTMLIWVCTIFIALITFIAFLPSLRNEFVNWDDPDYVSNNLMVVNDHIPLKAIFSNTVSLNYHPLTILSLALNYQLGGLDPFGYHLVNVLFHLMNTVFVFIFIFMLTKRNLLMSLIVSFFFGIHPMHVESVAWVSERKDVLYVFFFLAGLITYLKYYDGRKIIWYVFTLILFVLSCLCKGMAVVFPLILLLIDYLRETKWNAKVIVEKVPFLIISFGIGLLTYIVQQNGKALELVHKYSLYQRIMFASYGMLFYIFRLFFPFGLSAFYPYPALETLPVAFYIAPFIIVLLVFIVWFVFRKQKEIIFGLFFYIITIALVLKFISVGSTLLAERYSYLSYIGLLFILAHVASRIWQQKVNMRWLRVPIGMLLVTAGLVFTMQTYARNEVWKNEMVLWSDVIDKYPLASAGYFHRGCFYADQHQYDLAMADFDHVVRIDSNYPGVWINFAIYHSMTNQFDKALSEYDRAIAIEPDIPKIYFNRAVAYLNKGEFAKAEKDLTKAISLDSTNAEAFTDRAACYDIENQNQRAYYDLTRSINLRPGADAYNKRGLQLQKLGRMEESIQDFSKAIQLNAKVADYWYNLSISEKKMGHANKASSDSLKATQLGMKPG